MSEAAASLESTLNHAASTLRRLNRRFALVGGLAVSIRGEVRFTRDVDLAVETSSDADAESMVRDVTVAGYEVAALVEHTERGRLSIARLRSRTGIYLDLLVASSGIEGEIVAAASSVDVPGVGLLEVARAEELLAMKVLSMSDRRAQDRIDAESLLLANPDLDMARTRACLDLIRSRGFDRGEDLETKLEQIVARARAT